jgi:tape measure domain-containing protein
MGFNAGDLTASLNLNFQNFTRGMRDAARQAREMGSQFRSAFEQAGRAADGTTAAVQRTGNQMKDLERIVSGILLSQAFYASVSAIGAASSAVVEFTNNMEKAQISLEYFLGSAEQARGFMANMKDFAATTAFSTEQALTLSRRLMAAQFDPKQVRGVMEILNDASAASGGTAEQMDRIVLALSQIKTNGKVAGQELRQLAEAGIPIYKLLQEELGLTGKEIMNIGDLQIEGDLGVAAVLNGLEKRYKGAAERIADTIPGMMETIRDNSLFIASEMIQTPYKAMEEMLTRWRDTIEKARIAMTSSGLGGAMEAIFPPEVHESIRLITGSVMSLAQSFGMIHKAFMPVYQIIATTLTQTLGAVIPVIAAVVRQIANLITVAMQVAPPLKYLAAAILGLMVANVASKALLFLWSVTRMGAICAAIAQAVTLLRKSIQALFLVMTRNPLVAAIMIIAGALLYLAASSKTVSAWLDQVMARLASLGGFDLGKILEPKDTGMDKWSDAFNDMVDGIGENLSDQLDDTEDKGKETAKKMKKNFIAAFDEVFAMPENNDPKKDELPKMPGLGELGNLGGLDDLITDKMPKKIKLPDFEWPEIKWPMVPPALTRPINIKFKIDMPKWPDPGAFLEPVLKPFEALQLKIKTILEGLLRDVKGFAVEMPKLFPVAFPVGVFDGILADVKGWTGNLVGELAGLKGKISVPLAGVWDGLTLGLPKALGLGLGGIKEWSIDILQELGKLKVGIGSSLNGAWDGLTIGLPAVGALVLEGIKEWSGNAVNEMAAFKDRIIEGIQGAAAGAATAMAALVVDVVAKVADWGPAISTAFTTVMAAAKVAWDAGWGAITDIMGIIGDKLGTAISAVGTFIQDHWKEILVAIGIALAAVAAVILIPFEAVGAGVAAAAGAATLTAKAIATVLAGIGLTIAAWATKNKDAIVEWGKETWGSLSTWATDTWKIFTDWASDVGGSVLTWVTDTALSIRDFGSTVKTTFSAMWEVAKKHTKDAFVNMFKNIVDSVASIGTSISGLKNTVVRLFKEWTSEAWSKTKTFVSVVIASIATMPGKFATAIATIPGKFVDVMKQLPGKATSAVTDIIKPFTSLPGKIWDAIKSIPDKFAQVFSKIKIPSLGGIGDSVMSGLKSVGSGIGNIAGFAGGGVIDQDSIVRVGEKGRKEAIVPMENPTALKPFVDAIVAALPQQQAPSNGGGSDKQPIYVGTLIADDRSLKDLERRMNVIRMNENRRGGLPQ